MGDRGGPEREEMGLTGREEECRSKSSFPGKSAVPVRVFDGDECERSGGGG